jgi:hypothetical protein
MQALFEARDAQILSSEVFAVVSLTLFLPICLEQFARDNGVLLPDRSEPCDNTPGAALSPDGSPPRCVVKLGWFWVDSASYTCVSPPERDQHVPNIPRAACTSIQYRSRYRP